MRFGSDDESAIGIDQRGGPLPHHEKIRGQGGARNEYLDGRHAGHHAENRRHEAAAQEAFPADGSKPVAVGAVDFGFGGSGAWADPERQLGVAIVTNCFGGRIPGDLRPVAVATASARCADRRAD